ncbi:MAG TPA: class I SAM-dependent methyltransferase [Vicinamibacterales bacterium]|nr:class I SAM-dependent methyltransferase [Vicinamibacterales bacterium]
MSSAPNASVRAYWNAHIHDFEIATHPPGTPGFFAELEAYHFDKLHHLPRLVPYDRSAGLRVLDVGCGAGVDLARFAAGGARAVGVDLARRALELARANLQARGLPPALVEADGEALPFADGTFDLVFAHGVVQYTGNDRRLVEECRRVLRPGGTAIFQVYNRRSWLNALSRLVKVPLEHDDAPVLRKYTASEFRRLLGGFREVRLVYERFPVRSRLHGGWKGRVFNAVFVGAFSAIPRPLVRRFGWHLLAFCTR